MTLEIVLKVGTEYKGPRRFAIPNKETDPDVKDTTPPLLLPIDKFAPGFDLSRCNLIRIPNPTATVARIDDLVASPTSRASFGVKVNLSVRDNYFLMTELSPQRPATTMELASLGELNKELKWQVAGFVFDEDWRHRCEIIMGEIAEKSQAGPSPAVTFVKKHYSLQLDPRPLTKP